MECRVGKEGIHELSRRDQETWREYDASELVARKPFPGLIRIDQGTADPFLKEQLLPEKFWRPRRTNRGRSSIFSMQPGYDHGYYFMQTFMADHLRHHAAALK